MFCLVCLFFRITWKQTVIHLIGIFSHPFKLYYLNFLSHVCMVRSQIFFKEKNFGCDLIYSNIIHLWIRRSERK